MHVRRHLALIILMAGWSAVAQNFPEAPLARLLANEDTRATAISEIVKDGPRIVPTLLSWARIRLSNSEETGLYVGLADAFGKLKSKEAIPFLIAHIGLQRWLPSPNTWMKTPQVAEERLPAVSALIQIGPEASRALIRANWKELNPEERLAAILVLSQIKGVPEARGFLASLLGQANLERHWAEVGLKMMGVETPPR